MKQLSQFVLFMVFSLVIVASLHSQDSAESGASATIEKVKAEAEQEAAIATDSEKEGEEADEKKENIWKTLSRITYRKEFDELMGFKIDKPVFSQQVQKLEGTEITIKGYVIPVEGYKSHTEFIFSAFPYNMCFFCGGAGPETVMEVLASEPVKYSAEQVTLKGKIQLNADDINRLMYQLVDATLVDE